MASIKHNLNKFYQKLCATKAHLWSHYLSLLGWLYLPGLIILKSEYPDITFFLFHVLLIFVFLYTPFIIMLLFEISCYPIYIKELKPIYKNPIYNIIWLIGIILGLIFHFSILFILLYLIKII